jgi:hypothetical protein
MSALLAPGWAGGIVDQPDTNVRVAPYIGAITSLKSVTISGFPGQSNIEFLRGTSKNRPQVLILAG